MEEERPEIVYSVTVFPSIVRLANGHIYDYRPLVTVTVLPGSDCTVNTVNTQHQPWGQIKPGLKSPWDRPMLSLKKEITLLL